MAFLLVFLNLQNAEVSIHDASRSIFNPLRRRDLAEQPKPLTTGWFGRVNPFAFDIRTLDYAQGARRFDTGTPPYINAAAACAGMALLNTLDRAEVEARISGTCPPSPCARLRGMGCRSPARWIRGARGRTPPSA